MEITIRRLSTIDAPFARNYPPTKPGDNFADEILEYQQRPRRRNMAELVCEGWKSRQRILFVVGLNGTEGKLSAVLWPFSTW